MLEFLALLLLLLPPPLLVHYACPVWSAHASVLFHFADCLILIEAVIDFYLGPQFGSGHGIVESKAVMLS